MVPSDPPPLLPQLPREPDLIGQVLADRYRVDEMLGVGGMGHVFGGTHVTLRKQVAIKVLKQELSGDRTLVERFLREARAASVIAHENVVDIIDFGQIPGGSVFFVMERLVGRDLGALIDAEGRVSWIRTRNIALQIARALHAAHAVGVVHRDMKPGNVFLIERRGDNEYVKVLDFGIAKVDDPDGNVLTRAGSVFGTAAYMAPEQASGSGVDGRTDMYALACVMFEMLTGRLPFPGTNFIKVLSQHIKEPPPRPREVEPNADVSDEVEALLLRALAKRPEDRFADMGAFARAIAAANGETPTQPPREQAQPANVYIPLPTVAVSPAESGLPPDIRTLQHQISPAPVVEPEPPVPVPTADRTVMMANIDTSSLAAGVDDHLIAALAFLYVTFAHSTDGQLTNDEMRALADRLHHWAPQATLDQLGSMMRYTIGNYGQFPPADRLAHAHHYADWIAGRGTPAQRQQVLGDLQAIAIADGQVSSHEENFIAEIAGRLGIPIGPTADERLYALAFLYLAFGSTTSPVVGSDEIRILGNNLRKWAPGHSPERLAEVLKRAVADYRKLPGDGAKLAHARAWADSLKHHSGPEQLRQILADLWALAGADGYVSDEEQRFIMDTAQRFGLV